MKYKIKDKKFHIHAEWVMHSSRWCLTRSSRDPGKMFPVSHSELFKRQFRQCFWLTTNSNRFRRAFKELCENVSTHAPIGVNLTNANSPFLISLFMSPRLDSWKSSSEWLESCLISPHGLLWAKNLTVRCTSHSDDCVIFHFALRYMPQPWRFVRLCVCPSYGRRGPVSVVWF